MNDTPWIRPAIWLGAAWIAIAGLSLLTGCDSPAGETQSEQAQARPDSKARPATRPDQLGIPGRVTFPLSDPETHGLEVASFVEDVAVERIVPPSALSTQAMTAEIPTKAAPRRRGTGYPVPEGMFEAPVQVRDRAASSARSTRSNLGLRSRGSDGATSADGLSIGPSDNPAPQQGGGLPFVITQFEGIDFDTNASVTGFFSVPPDPHIAAGPNHVMTVVNTTVEAFNKNGGRVMQQSLSNFFAPLGPLTGTFDPKVMFDTQGGRWVVVTLEQTDRAFGDPADTSRIFVAASDDADPTGNWFMTAIDGRTFIGGSDHWADYPGFGVDEEAIYITTNMFQFFSGPGNFGGVRLWIVPKGALYNGQAVNVRRVDPYTNVNSFALTTQATQFFGNSTGVGGILLGYSGLSNTDGDSFLQVMRVNNPLGAVQVAGPEFVNLGQIEEIQGFPPVPDATQSGSGATIATNDRRALNSVWVNGRLYGAFTVRSNGQATAYWVELLDGGSGTPTVSRQASIPGEELGAGTHTYYPAVAANERGDVIVGYSASSPSRFAGAHYSIYPASVPVSEAGEPQLLRDGVGPYRRVFGTANRWGDYSGATVDPSDGCFWIFNEYAGAPGTPLGNTGDGRWATHAGKVCLALGFAQAPDGEAN